jgi:hypothetical protein
MMTFDYSLTDPSKLDIEFAQAVLSGVAALGRLPLCCEKLRREAVLPSLVACFTRDGMLLFVVVVVVVVC